MEPGFDEIENLVTFNAWAKRSLTDKFWKQIYGLKKSNSDSNGESEDNFSSVEKYDSQILSVG